MLLFGLISSAASAAENEPKRGPSPAWVRPLIIPAPDPALKDEAVQFLLIASQSRIDGTGENTYFEMVMRPQTVAGLQGAGTLALPWNVARTDMTVNAIEIRRSGKTIDLLKDAQFTVLRRENNLERATLDGIRTVVLPARGLQIDDDVRVAVTYSTRPDAKIGAAEDLSAWELPFPVAMLDRRIGVTDSLNGRWRTGARVPTPSVSRSDGWTEYHFQQANLPKSKYPSFLRATDKGSDIQFTTYRDWSQIASEAEPLYQRARTIAPAAELAAEADKIARASADPRERMLAALRLVQERMRYVALLLGESSHKPENASDAWEAKFGDCKAKTAVLLALLDRLGIAAQPMYTSAGSIGMLAERLPSLETFDHVIVKATIDGSNYFLDGTDFGHRTLADVSGAVFRHGLVLKAGATLEAIPAWPPSKPIVENNLVWDGSRGVSGDVPFTVRLTLRGVKAIEARAKKQTSETPEAFQTYLKELVPGIGNDTLRIVAQRDDETTGEYVVDLNGAADLDWSQYKGKQGYRFAFINSVSDWTPDFERKEGPFMNAAVELNPNYWERLTETLVLPDEKGFRLEEDSPLDVTIAGSRITRKVAVAGKQMTSTTDFRHLAEFISADEARKAEARLNEIADSWAFVAAPRGFKLPKD